MKRNSEAPPDFFGCEAAGLRWLAQARGATCVSVLGHDQTSLTLEHVDRATPTVGVADDFGAALAQTHRAGADAFGAAPDGWTGAGFFGPLHQPLPMSYARHESWGAFYAAERLQPMLERASRQLSSGTVDDLEAIVKRCARGVFDDDDGPTRIHGDLWSGNLLWTSAEVVLIDPAAHGGHREADLAMLALFGCPHLEVILEGYQRGWPLREGWQARLGLHQLYPLLAHVVLFGGGYARQVARVARATREIS